MPNTILIVEDTTQTKNLLLKIVSHLCPDFEVIALGDGMAALDYFASNPAPMLVLTDLEMPEMTGYDLIRTMQADDVLKSVPVVVVTSHADRVGDIRITREMEEQGLPRCPIVGKPLDIARLRETLDLILSPSAAV